MKINFILAVSNHVPFIFRFSIKYRSSSHLLHIGIITTKTRVDYEAIKQIYVNAYVTDTGIPQLTSTAEIIVDIININDNDPIFTLAEYRFSIAENSPKATVVGAVDAKDSDDGKFHALYKHKPSKIEFSTIAMWKIERLPLKALTFY